MPDDHDEAAVLASVPTEWEASFIADELSDRGIAAEVTGALTSGFRTEAPGLVRVIVPADQLARARQQLAEIREAAAHIDWSKIDVGEPEP